MNTHKKKIAVTFSKAARNYDKYAKLQKYVANKLRFNLPPLESPKILEIGAGTGLLTKHLLDKYRNGTFFITDISPNMLNICREKFNKAANIHFAVMDGEEPGCKLADPFDLIVSSMTVQWFNNSAKGITDLLSLLKPDGQILYSALAPDNMKEWKQILKDLGFPDGTLDTPPLPGHFANYRPPIEYESSHDFLSSMKKTGANKSKPGNNDLSFLQLRKACNAYDKKHKTGKDTVLSPWKIAHHTLTKT